MPCQRPANNPEGRSACGLRSLTSPRPNPAALAAPGSQSQAPCSFPCSPSPPRAAPGGFPEQNKTAWSCKVIRKPKPQCLRASQGRRLRALCRPRPQNGHPPPKRVGRRSPVAEEGATLTRVRREKPAFGGEKRVRGFWVRR
ncbi:unnamed protein product [Photorhabdus laumondii subsp. laumondii TTO1]|uniref:Photorhabdus luminescens subsp. laumondii TTO1 complete genome segment 13/17 n=1 Tax=Photorhabdus laumondii subsp. laumondii (strain DSM 15139 / CIP 105565 / TT01) TaxID=243265 RepID=Q7M784_PHOLL|nr:unnamed protein product [Photorhabdus laumondii subsp. laumondii TTO1]CAE16068.1 unnamed protein product [Photorhabdus laumondii subsp. laumondii TTO1]